VRMNAIRVLAGDVCLWPNPQARWGWASQVSTISLSPNRCDAPARPARERRSAFACSKICAPQNDWIVEIPIFEIVFISPSPTA
jgi:hypothetical protein